MMNKYNNNLNKILNMENILIINNIFVMNKGMQIASVREFILKMTSTNNLNNNKVFFKSSLKKKNFNLL